MSDSDGGRGGLGVGRRRRPFDDPGSDSSGRQGLGGGVLGGGRKRRRRQSDESVLGVFAQAGAGKGGGAGRGSSRLAGAVAFVRGETVQATEVPQPARRARSRDGGKSSDSDIDERFRFDGAPNAPKPAEQGPKLQAKNKLSFGQMASSYGKGFSLLKKMGFEGGGLGRHNDGIANPIEVLKRKDGMGLQDEGEKVGQDLYGHEAGGSLSVDEILGMGRRGKSDAPRASEGWKADAKTGGKRPRVEYKTAAQLLGEKPATMRIVDMRGPEVHVAASFSELAAAIGSSDSVRSLKELRFNARRLVGKYEGEIRTLAERKRYYEDVLLTLAAEEERLRSAAELGSRGTRSFRKLAEELETIRARQERGELGLRELGAALLELRAQWPEEFQTLSAEGVALALAVPAATSQLAAWRPLERPAEGFGHFDPWARLSDACGRGRAAGALLTDLVEAALLPRLRSAVVEWSVRDPEPCLRLIEACREAMPALAEGLAERLVLPKLRAEIDAWDPRVDRCPPHLWLHPWLPLLGETLGSLWAPMRLKLSACLERWNPSDQSALEMLKPWRAVFDPSNWDPLIGKVLSRLERGILEMPVRPDGQDVRPVKDLAAWVGVAPIDGLANVLDSALFPHWQTALRDWLRAPGCDFSEVLAWYQGWKALLPEALREASLVQRQLAHGLEVMKHVMSKGSGDEPLPPSAADGARAEEAVPRKPPAAAEEVSMSLSDYLAEVAGEEGLVFKPKRAAHNGKLVYQLGAASIYIERNLVYVAPKAGATGEWRPVSMDEVLALARASPPVAKRK